MNMFLLAGAVALGTFVAALEPATCGMMILGVGAAGGLLG